MPRCSPGCARCSPAWPGGHASILGHGTSPGVGSACPSHSDLPGCAGRQPAVAARRGCQWPGLQPRGRCRQVNADQAAQRLLLTAIASLEVLRAAYVMPGMQAAPLTSALWGKGVPLQGAHPATPDRSSGCATGQCRCPPGSWCSSRCGMQVHTARLGWTQAGICMPTCMITAGLLQHTV